MLLLATSFSSPLLAFAPPSLNKNYQPPHLITGLKRIEPPSTLGTASVKTYRPYKLLLKSTSDQIVGSGNTHEIWFGELCDKIDDDSFAISEIANSDLLSLPEQQLEQAFGLESFKTLVDKVAGKGPAFISDFLEIDKLRSPVTVKNLLSFLDNLDDATLNIDYIQAIYPHLHVLETESNQRLSTLMNRAPIKSNISNRLDQTDKPVLEKDIMAYAVYTRYVDQGTETQRGNTDLDVVERYLGLSNMMYLLSIILLPGPDGKFSEENRAPILLDLLLDEEISARERKYKKGIMDLKNYDKRVKEIYKVRHMTNCNDVLMRNLDTVFDYGAVKWYRYFAKQMEVENSENYVWYAKIITSHFNTILDSLANRDKYLFEVANASWKEVVNKRRIVAYHLSGLPLEDIKKFLRSRLNKSTDLEWNDAYRFILDSLYTFFESKSK
eukprot:NODE_265_length_12372_cov_0.450012.p3 type:complete len:440 gc:universal NODE_265_length_12372_cov_0.450012:1809-490(-)